MTRPALVRLLVLVALVAVSACDEATGIACTEEARAGVTVDVVDAFSEAPIVQGVTLTLRDGDYVESTDAVTPNGIIAGAWEREGTYEVTVEKAGFESWVRTGVVVTADACHVIGVRLRAELTPATAGGV